MGKPLTLPEYFWKYQFWRTLFVNDIFFRSFEFWNNLWFLKWYPIVIWLISINYRLGIKTKTNKQIWFNFYFFFRWIPWLFCVKIFDGKTHHFPQWRSMVETNWGWKAENFANWFCKRHQILHSRANIFGGCPEIVFIRCFFCKC